MTLLVSLAIFGWPLVVIALFASIPPRRAVITSMLGAWMFLPIAGFKLADGIPEVNKMSVTCLSVFIGIAIFDGSRLATLRPRIADLMMLVWLLVPVPSSISAGYGIYEGAAGAFGQMVAWGMPYLIGRLYFGNLEGLDALALAMFIGGLVYTPLVLFEVRMSPQLHTWVYGFHQHEFLQSKRGDSWRPTVFMQHGLAVALFMGTAALCGLWLWLAGGKRLIRAVPMWALVALLFSVAALCRSSYALMLMLAGSGALVACRLLNTRLFVVAILLVAPLYVVSRTVGGWDGQLLRDMATVMGDDREGSLSVRLKSEDVCWRFMQSHLVFGDGRMDRLMLREADGERFVPDALWLIVLTKNGVLGLIAMFSFLLGPTATYVRRHSARVLLKPEYSGATVLAMVLILYSMDNLLNAMINPIYALAVGGLAGLRRFPAQDVPSESRFAPPRSPGTPG